MSFLEGLLQGVAETTRERQKNSLQEQILKAQLGEIKAKQKTRQLTAQAMMGQLTPEMLQSALAPEPEAQPAAYPFQKAIEQDIPALASGAKNLFSSLTGMGGPPAPAESPAAPTTTSPLQQTMMGTPTTAPSAPPVDQRRMLATLLAAQGDGSAAVKLMTEPTPEQIQAANESAMRMLQGGGPTGNAGGSAGGNYTTVLPNVSMKSGEMPSWNFRTQFTPGDVREEQRILQYMDQTEYAGYQSLDPSRRPWYLMQFLSKRPDVQRALMAANTTAIDTVGAEAAARAVGGATPAAQGLRVPPQAVLGAGVLPPDVGTAALDQAQGGAPLDVGAATDAADKRKRENTPNPSAIRQQIGKADTALELLDQVEQMVRENPSLLSRGLADRLTSVGGIGQFRTKLDQFTPKEVKLFTKLQQSLQNYVYLISGQQASAAQEESYWRSWATPDLPPEAFIARLEASRELIEAQKNGILGAPAFPSQAEPAPSTPGATPSNADVEVYLENGQWKSRRIPQPR